MRKVVVKTGGFDWKYYNGFFHQWGIASYGETNKSIGIVELLNGKVITVDPWDIQFVEEWAEEK